MAWIKSHTLLLRHRKLAELAKSLRLKPVHTMGHLHALWHAAMEQQEDGNLSSWSDDFIADSSMYSGDVPQYVRLLQEHGWLDGKVIHDWLDYAGGYLTSKYKSNNKQRLVDIWRAHGRDYGTGSEEEVSRKEIGSARLDKTRLEKIKLGSVLKRSDCTIVEVDSGLYSVQAKAKINSNEVTRHENQNHLLERVVEFAHDEGSRAFFQKAIKKLGGGLVEEAMGEVKMREADGSVNSRAPYFIALLENWMDNRP